MTTRVDRASRRMTQRGQGLTNVGHPLNRDSVDVRGEARSRPLRGLPRDPALAEELRVCQKKVPHDPPHQGGPIVSHEKTLCEFFRAVAFTGRYLSAVDRLPAKGKVIERWRRKVTGLRVYRQVRLWQAFQP
jgi:hypothetical protein